TMQPFNVTVIICFFRFRISRASLLFPYTTLFRSYYGGLRQHVQWKNFSLDLLLELVRQQGQGKLGIMGIVVPGRSVNQPVYVMRSEEHTSELQSRGKLVCRFLLEKKKHGY